MLKALEKRQLGTLLPDAFVHTEANRRFSNMRMLEQTYHDVYNIVIPESLDLSCDNNL